QKLRLRVYNETDINSTAFFEIKQKHQKVVNKRRMILPLAEAYRYLDSFEETLDNFETSNTQVLREIDHFRHLYNLQSEMIGSYVKEVLVTIDLHLHCRNDDLSVENGQQSDSYINANLVVLEVKINDSLPLWLTRILQDLRCEQRSASKYCTSSELLKSKELPNGIVMEDVVIGGGV